MRIGMVGGRWRVLDDDRTDQSGIRPDREEWREGVTDQSRMKARGLSLPRRECDPLVLEGEASVPEQRPMGYKVAKASLATLERWSITRMIVVLWILGQSNNALDVTMDCDRTGNSNGP
jgi:hypothetical protein